METPEIRLCAKHLRHAADKLEPDSPLEGHQQMRRVILSMANYLEYGNPYRPQLAAFVQELGIVLRGG